MNHRTKTNLWVDILIFIVFLIVYEEKATGTTIHEWIGIAIGLVFIVHIILHWKWLLVNTQLFLHRMRTESRINYVLDILIFFGFTTIIFTGIMISESFLPTFGIKTLRSHYWQEIHSVSVNFTLFLVAIHFALHWKWIVNNFKRFIIGPIKNRAITYKIPNQVKIKPALSTSGYFSSFFKLGFQLIIILALSGLISLGWYAAAGTGASEPNVREYRQNRERNAESEFRTDGDKRPERIGHNRRGYNNENGHHEEEGFFGIELLKNLLIFSVVTIIITKFINVTKRKKNPKLPVKG